MTYCQAAPSSYAATVGSDASEVDDPTGNGVFYRNSIVRFTDITDGTSQTVMAGDRAWADSQGTWAGVPARSSTGTGGGFGFMLVSWVKFRRRGLRSEILPPPFGVRNRIEGRTADASPSGLSLSDCQGCSPGPAGCLSRPSSVLGLLIHSRQALTS